MRRRLPVLLVALSTATLFAQSPAPNLDVIQQRDLRADLFFYASDAMRGRLTDTPENRIASEFLKSRFERMGLAPATPGYFQNYDLMTATLGEKNEMDLAPQPPHASSTDEVVPVNQRWYPQRFSATGHVKAPVVFAGYGITAPDLAYDDYGDGSAIRGKIVLVVDGEPGARDPSSPFDGVVTSELSASIHKAQAAQAKGAVGILFVARPPQAPNGRATAGSSAAGVAGTSAAVPVAGAEGGAAAGRGGAGRGGAGAFENSARNFWPAQPPRLERYTIAAWMNAIAIPCAQIAPQLADDLIAGSTDPARHQTGKTLADLAEHIDTPHGVVPTPLPGYAVDLTTSVQRHAVADRNVLAKIDGADPRLANEWVVISGHIDHDGANGDQIFNGADDNGSGAIGVLEIAQAYAAAAKAGHRPRRSILFAEFNSEERGLLGSWAYTEQPIAPLDQTIAILNMDMVGRNEEIPAPDAGGGRGGGGRFNGLEPQTAASNANAFNVIGTVRSPDLAADITRANANASTKLDIHYRYDNNVSQLLRRSDQWPFVQHVPGVWIFTGLHPDYHMPGDRPEKINYEKMQRILEVVYQASWNLANADGRPRLLPRTAAGVPGPIR